MIFLNLNAFLCAAMDPDHTGARAPNPKGWASYSKSMAAAMAHVKSTGSNARMFANSESLARADRHYWDGHALLRSFGIMGIELNRSVLQDSDNSLRNHWLNHPPQGLRESNVSSVYVFRHRDSYNTPHGIFIPLVDPEMPDASLVFINGPIGAAIMSLAATNNQAMHRNLPMTNCAAVLNAIHGAAQFVCVANLWYTLLKLAPASHYEPLANKIANREPVGIANGVAHPKELVVAMMVSANRAWTTMDYRWVLNEVIRRAHATEKGLAMTEFCRLLPKQMVTAQHRPMYAVFCDCVAKAGRAWYYKLRVANLLTFARRQWCYYLQMAGVAIADKDDLLAAARGEAECWTPPAPLVVHLDNDNWAAEVLSLLQTPQPLAKTAPLTLVALSGETYILQEWQRVNWDCPGALEALAVKQHPKTFLAQTPTLELQVGNRVTTQNLKAEAFNYRSGVVVLRKTRPGRVPVLLDGDKTPTSLPAEALTSPVAFAITPLADNDDDSTPCANNTYKAFLMTGHAELEMFVLYAPDKPEAQKEQYTSAFLLKTAGVIFERYMANLL
jgi:hypothetical protein